MYQDSEKIESPKRKCCATLLVVVMILLLLTGLAVAIVAALSLWGPTEIRSAIEAIFVLRQFKSAQYALFALGLLMILTAIFGFVIARCYAQGNPVHCVTIIFYLFTIILFIMALALAIFGIIFRVDKSVLGIESPQCPGGNAWSDADFIACNSATSQDPTKCLHSSCIFDKAFYEIILRPQATERFNSGTATFNSSTSACSGTWCDLQKSFSSCGWFCGGNGTNTSVISQKSCYNSTGFTWQATGENCFKPSSTAVANTRQEVIALLSQIDIGIIAGGSVAVFILLLTFISSTQIGTCCQKKENKYNPDDDYMSKQNKYNPTYVAESEVYR